MEPPRPPLPPGHAVTMLMRATGHAYAAPLLAKLGIPDLLAERPRTAAELAEATGTRPDALARLLAFCTTIELLFEHPDGVFQLTETGRGLVTGPFRTEAVARGERAYLDRWAELETSLRAGPRTADPPPAPGVDLVTLRRARVAAAHRSALAAYAAGFSRSGTYVDIGSGDPTLVEGILKASPRSEAVYLGSAEELVRVKAHLSAAGVAHRCELAIPGADLPAGDAFVVSNLLEELGDDAAATLLGRCRAALRPHGRVLLIGPLVHDRARRRLGYAALVDLEMLLFTPSGTVRSEEALHALCTRAGLSAKSFVPAQGDFVLEAVAR